MSEKNQNKNNPLLSNQNPWLKNSNSIWLGSSLTLIRNLEKSNFPGKLPDDKKKQIVSLLSKDFLSSQILKNPQLIKSEEMPPLHKEFLVEHFLTSQGFHQAQSGEAFILDESSQFLATLNLRDHVVFYWIDCKEELETAWDQVVKIEMELNKRVSFAFSSRFGFLTSDPLECGTGLIVCVFLHLPALICTGQLEDVLSKYILDDGIQQTGLQGDPEEIIGDIVAFHNNYTLGLTEENIISSLRTLTTKLLVEEKSLRSHIKQKEDSDIKDKVSRAYAILLHSYQIEPVEALNAISLLKLGLDLGWVENISHAELNQLLLNCRRAHLLCQIGEDKLSQEEIPHKRAEFIHRVLKGVILHI